MNGQNALCALWMLSRAPLWSRVHTRLLSRYGSPEEVYAAAVRKALDPTCFSAEEIARFCDPDLFAAKEHLYRWILVLLPVRPKKFPGKSLSILCVLSLTTVRPRW